MEGYVYVEHSDTCKYKGDRFSRRCNCRKWIYIARERRRIPAKTRSWSEAEKRFRAMQEGGSVPAGKTVESAVTAYLIDKQQQNIDDSYYEKLDLMLRREFVPFCKAKPIPTLPEITLAHLEEFRATWKGAAITRRKKQERLRSFFHYCIRHEWLKTNIAANLSRIKVENKPTEPFTREEWSKLLDAIPLLGMDSRNPNQQQWRDKLRALLLLMRWSGLRIGDAVTLRRDRLRDGSLLLYTQKTGVPVFVPLHKEALEALKKLPRANDYYFWSGNGLKKSCVADYQRSFYRLMEHAKLGKHAHLHMIRDTFAVEMLLAGVPIEQVAVLLGHSSIRVTERSYSPWVHARQKQLEASIRKAWG